MQTPVLMVDDDRAMAEMARDYLRRFDYAVVVETKPLIALKRIVNEHYAAAVVDVMMPQMDGFQFVKEARAAGARLPLLMLTARGEVADRVVGLELGADDYLPKPFEPRELAARLAALLRRAEQTRAAPAMREFAQLRFCQTTRQTQIWRGGKWQSAALTAGEFAALAALIAAAPAVATREELSARLRNVEFDFADRALDLIISRLRAKLGDNPRRPRFIQTVRNAGYVFVAEEKPKQAPAAAGKK